MKKFVEFTVQFKFVWGLFFTAAMLLYTTISMILGAKSMEFVVVWKFVLITLIITSFHYLIFGELILSTTKTKYKVMIHSILCYVTLFIWSAFLNWVSISSIISVMIFTLGYITLYSLCMLSFYIYYKSTGEELNNRLTAYKQNLNKEKSQ
ncbi:hypothetical protein SDC9_125427 [bioreactor metagenome]|uniref:DUF3021 domain-containing protein n=1 Tax=bioreactor metagenome TaxID=1076179 RepID=A0A645CN08_9ZZZZ|nr:DUF3021 family protein [Clostridium sp. HMP27]KGK89953.1 hypothetical protein DP68_02895 [Clostridium sp. HMP27]